MQSERSLLIEQEILNQVLKEITDMDHRIAVGKVPLERQMAQAQAWR